MRCVCVCVFIFSEKLAANSYIKNLSTDLETGSEGMGEGPGPLSVVVVHEAKHKIFARILCTVRHANGTARRVTGEAVLGAQFNDQAATAMREQRRRRRRGGNGKKAAVEDKSHVKVPHHGIAPA